MNDIPVADQAIGRIVGPSLEICAVDRFTVAAKSTGSRHVSKKM